MNEPFPFRQVFEGKWTQGAIPLVLLVALLLIIEIAAPGFLTGGPNPSYNWDACCPSNCSSAANNAMCGSAAPSPPRGQPQQKAYKDFNNGWPLNSWSVTEPSNGYQVAYIRLLSKFVR